MPDRLFAVPELANLYDPLDPDRGDLDAYLAILERLRARSVLDVGCGTGTFALLLADSGIEVTGLDPAEASLAVAMAKPGSHRVTWVHDDATTRLQTRADALTMTGNVAQVFLTDDEWADALRACRHNVRPGGYLVFETRNPTAEAWLGWHREGTYRTAVVDGIGVVACWEETTAIAWPTVSFQTFFVFPDGSVRTSTSTLRFRDLDDVTATLQRAGFRLVEVREAPDRPGRELVVIAQSRT